MPELTWTTALAWFGVLASAASIGGLILGAVLGLVTWRQNRATTKLIVDGHAATQLTLKDVHATTQETLKAMHTATQDTLRTLGEGQQRLGAILDRMDQQAEQRYRDLKDRLDGEEGPRC
jgi:flagellar biosynthesis component FlhA